MIFGDEMDDMTNDGDDSDDDDEDEDSENDDELLHSPGGSDDNDVSVEELDLDEDARVALMAELDGGEGADQEWRDVLNQLGEAAAGDPLNGAGDEESEGERAEAEFDHQGVALIRDEEDAETDEDEEDYSDQDQVFIEGELEFDEAALFDARPGGRYGWDAALTGVEGARRQRMGQSSFPHFLTTSLILISTAALSRRYSRPQRLCYQSTRHHGQCRSPPSAS